MTAGSSSFIVDADLHGLVDGHIEIDRRADALRRLAASPIDRARVEAWQGQNDLLRSAFAGVDREPLPVLLDLRAKPRLQCIPAHDAALDDDTSQAPGAASRLTTARRRFGFAVATILLICGGMGGAWSVLVSADTTDTVTTAKLRGSVDATVATRSADAIDRTVSPAPAVPAQSDARLPTTQIPDLRATGFSFTGAEIDASEPMSILFRYQNGDAERLAISVARTARDGAARGAPVRIGNAFIWHRRDNVFGLAGTLRPARLRAIAVALQNGEAQD